MNRRIHTPSRSLRIARRGMTAFIVIVAMAFVATAGTLLLKVGLVEQRQVNRLKLDRQAGWLAEAGLDRAAARLSQAPGYSGEAWTITNSDLGGSSGAVVRIVVRADRADSSQRTIEAAVELLDGDRTPSRVSKQLVVSIR